MKQMKLITMFILVLAAQCGAAAAQASPGAFLKKQDQKLEPLLKDTEKNRQKIIEVVDRLLDFETLSKDSLGKYWEMRSEEDRKEFTNTLQALIEKNLVNRLKDTKDHRIVYGREEVTGRTATVVTLVSPNDDPRAETTEIAYKLQKKTRDWSVVDMVTDGVSLVGNYRSEFSKIITEDGWDALIKKMKDKLAE